jgi:hypothetical protein
MCKGRRVFNVLTFLALLFCLALPSQLFAEDEIGQWINHLDFLPGSSDVVAEYNSAIGLGGGLVITSTATTDTAIASVVQGLQVPAGYLVNGVRVCYAVIGENYIDEVSISQLQDPPYGTDIVLFDTTSLNSTDPVCVNTFLTVDGPIDPSMGALTLRFGVNFVDTAESVVIYGVGLLTVPDPDSPVSQLEDDVAQLEDDVEQLNSNIKRIAAVLIEHGVRLDNLDKDLDRLTNAVIKHTHIYRTGKGVGHNKVEAASSTLIFVEETPEPKPEAPVVEEKSKEKSKKKSKKRSKKKK